MDASSTYFPKLKSTWSDPRLTINCGDAAIFMKNAAPNTYDVIICDTSDPDGPAQSLFGPDFYKNMHTALRPGGVICTQAESIWLHVPLIKELIENAKQFYPMVDYAITNVPTYPCGSIGLLVCKKEDGDNKLVDCKTPVRPIPEDMKSKLVYYNQDLHTAAFARPTFINQEIDALLK